MPWSLFLNITKALLPFLVACATALLAKGAQYALHAVGRIKDESLQRGLDWAIHQAEELAEIGVVAANQTIVNELKAKGHWSPTTKSRVFQGVLASVTGQLNRKALSILQEELSDVPDYLSTLIESKVATAPNRIASHV